MVNVCFQKPDISAVDWGISPKFGMQVDFDLPRWAKLQKPKPEVELRCRGRHLGKWIWRHNCVADGPIWTKFGRQGDATVKIGTGSRIPTCGRLFVCFQKPEVVISRPMIEISRRNFSMQADWCQPSHLRSRKRKPEIELRCRGRRLEKKTWRHNSVADDLIWTKFNRQMQSDMYAEAAWRALWICSSWPVHYTTQSSKY